MIAFMFNKYTFDLDYIMFIQSTNYKSLKLM